MTLNTNETPPTIEDLLVNGKQKFRGTTIELVLPKNCDTTLCKDTLDKIYGGVQYLNDANILSAINDFRDTIDHRPVKL